MRGARLVVVTALLAAALTATTAGAQGGDPSPAHQAIIGPGVHERVAQRSAGGPPIVAYLEVGDDRRRGSDTARAATSRAQARVIDALPDHGIAVRFQGEVVPVMTFDITSPAALDALAARPEVVRIDVDATGGGDLAQVVPLIGADASHAAGDTGAGVRVAILDTGIDTDHPDLSDDLVRQECFAGATHCPNGSGRQSGAGSAEDDAGHGTHVSGIVTGAGTVAPVGVAPDAEVAAFKVMWSCPDFPYAGCFDSFTENVVAPLDWIAANNDSLGIDVINASLGTTFTTAGDCDGTTTWTMAGADAVWALREIGVTVFASAGNLSLNEMGAPACLSGVISVGALTDAGAPAGFSNASATTDVFAPGVNVLSGAIGGGTFTASGTSMASPATAACAALLLGAGQVSTPAMIESRLETSSTTVSKNGHTYPSLECDTSGGPSFWDVQLDHVFSTEIEWMAEQGIAGGYADLGFHPTDPVTRQAMAAFIARYVGMGAFVDPSTPTFPDVPTTHPFFTEIEWMAANGYATGYADGGFHPTGKISRQAFTAFLYRIAGEPTFADPSTPTFYDVSTTHPFFTEIEWSAANGIITGYADDGFHPATAVSRQATAALLYRYDGL